MMWSWKEENLGVGSRLIIVSTLDPDLLHGIRERLNLDCWGCGFCGKSDCCVMFGSCLGWTFSSPCLRLPEGGLEMEPVEETGKEEIVLAIYCEGH